MRSVFGGRANATGSRRFARRTQASSSAASATLSPPTTVLHWQAARQGWGQIRQTISGNGISFASSL